MSIRKTNKLVFERLTLMFIIYLAIAGFLCYKGFGHLRLRRRTFIEGRLINDVRAPSMNCSGVNTNAFWVDFSIGFYQVGLSGDPNPLMTYQENIPYTVTRVGILSFDNKAELQLDIPCAED